MDVTYNINNPRALNLGHQYDHNVRTVTFTGFTPVDDTNTIYLKFEGLGLYPLVDMSFAVSQSFTLKSGTFSGQLFELASDNTLVQNSDVFKIMVKPSIAEDEEIVQEDASISLWFTEMSDLYNEVREAYESGTLVTKENITAALGYTPADAADVPSKVSDLENDAGYITGITSADITDAIGYTPANSEDVPVNVSDLFNDAEYISGISDSDVVEALGYTPADNASLPSKVSDLENDTGYITGITSKDVSDALGYVPADEEHVVVTIDYDDVVGALKYIPADEKDLPVVPTVVSAFLNDAGYIDGITSDDVLSALGYMPADVNYGNFTEINNITTTNQTSSIVISEDNEGHAFSLDGAIILISNDNGIRGGSNSYLYAYDADGNVIGGTRVFFYGGSSTSKAVIEIEIRGGIVDINSAGWSNSSPYSPVNKSLICEKGSSGRISKIEIVGNGQFFNTGTSVRILGYQVAQPNKYGQFDLVKNIVLSSDTESVVVTTTNEGNVFKLSGFAVMMSNDNGIGGGTNGYVYAYDPDNNVVGSQMYFAGGNSIMRSAVEAEIRGDIIEMNSIGWNINTPYSPNIKSLVGSVNDAANNIVKIEITGNGRAISAGTIINIYGVKI